MKDKTSSRTLVLAVCTFLTFAFVAIYSFDVSWRFLLEALGYCIIALLILLVPACLFGWLIMRFRKD